MWRSDLSHSKSTRSHHSVRWLVALALVASAQALAQEPPPAEGLAAELRVRIEAAPNGPTSASGQPIRARVALQRFYVERAHRPAWTGEAGGAALEALIQAIEEADRHGLSPGDYHLAALRDGKSQDPVARELLATDAYLTLAAHLVGGRLDPTTVEPDWTASRRERDLPVHLSRALEGGRIAESLVELEPDAAGYAVLKGGLALYRRAAEEGGWPEVPPGRALEIGASGPRVRALRARLRASGLVEPRTDAPEIFDAELEVAVAAFQRRIGLEPDGVVGPLTRTELNKSAQDRVDQVRVNLERWRWLPEDLGARHVRVNIADYRLEARANGRIERTHDVIIGRPYRKTPVFSGQMRYLVLNPWWETPDNLARLDKLPSFQADPGTIERLGFEVRDAAGKLVDARAIDWSTYSSANFPFRIRQRPGPQNALGQVKMIFPNPHNVYLHDTPSRELFARHTRAFSSGCVRVANVLELATWALEGTPEWKRTDVEAIVASGAERRVDLATPLPVHILYFTAVSEPDGSLRLIGDVYGRDARVLAALAEPAPAARGAR